MKHALRPVRLQVYAVVLICTAEQWLAVQTQFPNSRPGSFRGREFFSRNWGTSRVVFLRVGEGVITAAATVQFGIDRWDPDVLMTTVCDSEAESEAMSLVAELNGVPMAADAIVATNLEATVPAAIANARKAEQS